jgi:murein L,D-transpeptidase YcbB/YkuD
MYRVRLDRAWRAGAAALAIGVASAMAEEAPTPVAPPPKIDSAPLPLPTPRLAVPTPQAVTAAPLPSTAPTPAATSAEPPKAPAPLATPASTPAPAPSAAPVTTPVVQPGSEPAPAPIPADLAPKRKPKPAPPPLETALSTDPHPTFGPETYALTLKAEQRYAHIVEEGGWATDLPALRAGSQGEAVAKLRRHLALEGDLEDTRASSRKWDAGLTAAVKHFQNRMGLRATGSVAGATLKAINVSAETRRQELGASAARLSNLHFEFEKRYVVVNLPSTSVEAVQDGQVAHRYVAIVGDPDHPSPEISAHISVINLNPTWTVPTSIIKKEIIPHMQRDPSYLSRMKIRVLDGQLHEVEPRSVDWSTERATNYILRQDSGAGNSLGSIRIGMPNKLAVYMHDTPGKALFGRDFRFLSHGCVRVQGVYDYAAWLLEETPGGAGGAWDKTSLLDKQKDKVRYDIKLSHAVPVIWVYLTGWSNEEGIVNFRSDVYGADPAAEANAAAAAATANAEAQARDVPEAPPAPPPPEASPIFDFLRNH